MVTWYSNYFALINILKPENLSTRTLFRRDYGGKARVSGTLGVSGKEQ